MPELSKRSFTSGELSPNLRDRADLTKYVNGLYRCEGFIIKAQGGVINRPGFRFIGGTSFNERKSRLIKFEFNTDQTYALLFEHEKIKFIQNGGFVLNAQNDIYEIASPYQESELFDLYYTQSADVMTITHPSHPQSNLIRMTNDDWSLTPISYESLVPVPVWHSTNALSNTGSGGGDFNKTYGYMVSAVVDGVESLPSEMRVITSASLSITFGLVLNWDPTPTVADYYRIYKEIDQGAGVFGWIGESTSTEFTDFNIAPLSSDAPVSDNNPFENGNNPSVTGYYQQRQLYANTTLNPQTLYTSRTAEYNSMRLSRPVRDDDAITLTLASNQLNEIRHIISLNSLVLLTSAGEWVISEGQDQVLTPNTIGARIQSYNGASKVKPVIINDTAIYIQGKGAKVRDLGYQFDRDSYTGNNLSIMSEHLFEGFSIVDMVYAEEPHGVLWCVRSDGFLLGLTYQKEHEVWGWHKHSTDGFFESVTSISENDQDVVYAVVRRTVNGNAVRYIERLQTDTFDTVADSLYLDSSLQYNGVAVSTLSGLDHLEGKSVVALADGNVVDGLVVTNGTVAIPRPASKISVGLEYTQVIETLDIDSAGDAIKSFNVSVNKVIISFLHSRGGFVSSRISDGQYTDAQEIKPRFQSDNYDTVTLRTYLAEVATEMSWGKSGGVRLEQRSPLPMRVLSITPRFDIGGN